MPKERISAAEKEIDIAFSKNELKNLGYTQAIWTLLSIIEVHHLSCMNAQYSGDEYGAFVDTYMNALNYPLSVCYNEADREINTLKKEFIEEDYNKASKWLDEAIKYGYFCSIFSFWHKNKIDLMVDGYNLIPPDWTKLKLEYEAYNRLVRKDGKNEVLSNPDYDLINYVNTRIRKNKFYYSVNFNPQLVSKLFNYFNKINLERCNLPDNWKFLHFTIREFKLVYTTIQSILYGWLIARVTSYNNREQQYGYSSSVYVVEKNELLIRLSRYTKLDYNKVKIILKYLMYALSAYISETKD